MLRDVLREVLHGETELTIIPGAHRLLLSTDERCVPSIEGTQVAKLLTSLTQIDP
jgi:hypothetical protein